MFLMQGLSMWDPEINLESLKVNYDWTKALYIGFYSLELVKFIKSIPWSGYDLSDCVFPILWGPSVNSTRIFNTFSFPLFCFQWPAPESFNRTCKDPARPRARARPGHAQLWLPPDSAVDLLSRSRLNYQTLHVTTLSMCETWACSVVTSIRPSRSRLNHQTVYVTTLSVCETWARSVATSPRPSQIRLNH